MSSSRLLRPAAAASRVVQRRALHSTRVARDHFLDADSAAFKTYALAGSAAKPVLVDFYAGWCQPCRVLTPILKGLTGPESGYDLVTVDVDEHPELAAEYKVTALPTVVAFRDGKVKNKFVGFRPEGELKKFLGML
ncbi:hypothetical protein Q5752_005696 [Cryptotrichosporon argae]